MEDSGSQIIQQLRKRVQQQQAQRKSQKIKAQTAAKNENIFKESNNDIIQKNIFASLKKPQSANLFGGDRKSVNLFKVNGNQIPKSQNGGQDIKNIFNVEQKPAIVKDSQSNDSSGKKSQNQPQSDELYTQTQNLFKSVPEQKIMKFQYKNQMTKLVQMNIKKFKNGTALAKEDIYITLQKLDNQQSTLYLIVRSNTTKVLVYQGIMIKNISKLEHFMGKNDNLRFNVVKKNNLSTSNQSNQEGSSARKLIKQNVKLQFESAAQCEEFQKAVNNHFIQGSQ